MRPFVYRLAVRCGLSGFIQNDTDGVIIEVQGPAERLEAFAQALEHEHPPLAVFRDVTRKAIDVAPADAGFAIRSSSGDGRPTAAVTVDTAVCAKCVTEMLDARDRRYGYALTNCTDCGPRYSIIRKVPYDRPNTTMAGFAMCPDCAREYHTPGDRRFHAQPIACPTCGPRVELRITASSLPEGVTASDPIDAAVELLLAGKIVAIKGIGGFHLSVRADDAEAVRRLRRLKGRDSKPFAVMCRGLTEVRRLVDLSPEAEAALTSPAAPIVLAPMRTEGEKADDAAAGPANGMEDSGIAADLVAPGCHRLGVMLPYTPIHHLLFARGGPGMPVLVMTSGNVTDEPIVIDNDDAIQRLGGLCDAILLHDRPIERCVDDSVLLDMGQGAALADSAIARICADGGDAGCAGAPRQEGDDVAHAVDAGVYELASAPTGLCVGGELKSTVAVVRQGRVILSQHLGDLTHPLAYAHFEKAIGDLLELYEIEPRWIAHDLHPIYLSTQYARRLGRQWRVPLLGIQHHHAHAAALMAEHNHQRGLLAVVCDGVGYGPDGTSWGGELLVAQMKRFCRLAHLRPLVLPGGDAAARDTRRSGSALLHQALGDDFDEHPAARRLVSDDGERKMLAEMMRRRINCAISSSAGRVFDGVAALLGVCTHNEYEAQAPMRLEALASSAHTKGRREPAYVLEGGDVRQIDLSPLTRLLLKRQAQGMPVEELARLFHCQFARAWARVVGAAAELTGLWCVGLSGGVFCNQLLTRMLTCRLEMRGIRVLRHRQVPPSDGGIALGQAAIACAMMENCLG